MTDDTPSEHPIVSYEANAADYGVSATTMLVLLSLESQIS